jgi:hypothetical protein
VRRSSMKSAGLTNCGTGSPSDELK